MILLKKFIVTLSVVFLILGISGYGISSHIGNLLIQNIPNYQKNLIKKGIDVLYDDVSTQNCVLSVCLKAQNVRLKIANREIPLGNVSLDFSFLNHQNGFLSVTPQQNNGLLLEADMKNGVVFIDKSQFIFQDFQASFIGEYDLHQAQIIGVLDSVNLAYFVKHFAHPSFYGMIDLFLTDKEQKINIDTSNSFMRLNKFPVLKLKPILF